MKLLGEFRNGQLVKKDEFVPVQLSESTEPATWQLDVPANFDAGESQIILANNLGDQQANLATKLVVVLAEGAQLKLTLDNIGLAGQANFVHICTEVLLGKGAKLKLVILNHGVAQNWEYNALNVRQQAESEFVLITISDDGMVRRNATYVDLVAPKAKCDLNFLTRAAGHSQVFEHVVVNHQAAECESRQLAKAILDDAAITEFNGTIKVVAQAQHTVAHQLNRNLLLSAQAKASARPQMRVLANQVECTHGATIGQLDDEQVFYFLSRGFSPEQARKILVTGFAEEIMAKLAG